MANIEKEFEQIDSFLIFAKTIDTFKNCHTIYDLLGIKNKDAPYSDIEQCIKEFEKLYSGNNAPKFKIFAKTVSGDAERIRRVLKDHHEEYKDYLRTNDPRIKQIRLHFNFCTKRDGELDFQEKSDLVQEGMDAGLSESEIKSIIAQWVVETGVKEVADKADNTNTGSIPFDELLGKTYYEIFGISRDADYSEIKKVYEFEYKRYNDARDKARANARWVQITAGWDILKDKEKRRRYNEKLDQPPEVDDRDPVLKVISDIGGYVYKDVRKGRVINQKIVIKNCGGGQLKGKILSTVNWLVLERDNLTYKHEQSLEISILTSKIPVNTYDTKGSITIDTNGGPPFTISFRVILEGLEIAAERFKKTYVPLIAAVGGFVFSFSKSPVLHFIYGAVCAGVISFLCAKLIVQYFLKEGVDIFQFPPVLIQAAAVGVFFLSIISHSGGGSAKTQPPDNYAPIAAPAAEMPAPAAEPAPAAPAAPEAEVPATPPAEPPSMPDIASPSVIQETQQQEQKAVDKVQTTRRPYDIVHYGSYYYLYHQGKWYSSRNSEGPWILEREDNLPYQLSRHQRQEKPARTVREFRVPMNPSIAAANDFTAEVRLPDGSNEKATIARLNKSSLTLYVTLAQDYPEGTVVTIFPKIEYNIRRRDRYDSPQQDHVSENVRRNESDQSLLRSRDEAYRRRNRLINDLQ